MLRHCWSASIYVVLVVLHAEVSTCAENDTAPVGVWGYCTGFIGTHHDLSGWPRKTTLNEAKLSCWDNQKCVGITFAGSDPHPCNVQWYWLKTKWSCYLSTQWRSYHKDLFPLIKEPPDPGCLGQGTNNAVPEAGGTDSGDENTETDDDGLEPDPSEQIPPSMPVSPVPEGPSPAGLSLTLGALGIFCIIIICIAGFGFWRYRQYKSRIQNAEKSVRLLEKLARYRIQFWHKGKGAVDRLSKGGVSEDEIKIERDLQSEGFLNTWEERPRALTAITERTKLLMRFLLGLVVLFVIAIFLSGGGTKSTLWCDTYDDAIAGREGDYTCARCPRDEESVKMES